MTEVRVKAVAVGFGNDSVPCLLGLGSGYCCTSEGFRNLEVSASSNLHINARLCCDHSSQHCGNSIGSSNRRLQRVCRTVRARFRHAVSHVFAPCQNGVSRLIDLSRGHNYHSYHHLGLATSEQVHSPHCARRGAATCSGTCSHEQLHLR